jgi:glucokinase
MADNYSLGIDVGGTKIYAVVLNENSDVISQAKLRTDSSATPERIAEQIKSAGHQALSEIDLSLKDVGDIGVALPSSIDPETGDCLHAPNLGLKNFSIKEHFKKLFDREVFLGNDGNCGILGEIACGAAKGYKSAVGYFVGTGLGGGIIIDGKLLTGNGGVAGELGHAIVRYKGVRCNCGHKGCIEAYCSKAGFVKALKKEIIGKSKDSAISDHINKNTANIKSKFLARAYRQNDKVVVKTLHRGMKKLGAAAASAAVTVAPECIVLGGGVMEAMGEELLPVFKESFEKHLFGIDPSKVTVRLSALKDYAVAVGATILAKRKGKA